MRDAVIVEAVRTPVGKRNGGLSGIHPTDLSAHVLRALAERTGVDPAIITVDRQCGSLINHMRANGIRYGLQTMCEGGGQANATIFELL